jgi:hypothetical protein
MMDALLWLAERTRQLSFLRMPMMSTAGCWPHRSPSLRRLPHLSDICTPRKSPSMLGPAAKLGPKLVLLAALLLCTAAPSLALDDKG